MAAIAVTAIICKKLLTGILKQTPKSTVGEQSKSRSALSAVELAYLARSDDLFHVVLVMAADLLQRTIKSSLTGTGPPILLDYEVKMWEITQDFVKGSAQKKIEPYLPNNFSTNPISYFKRLSSLYGALLRLIRRFSEDILRDPRNLRRYFSIGGLLRLVTDFFSSGYQELLTKEIARHLTENNLLVPSQKCLSFSNIFLLVGTIFALISLLTALAFVPHNLIFVMPILAIACATIISLTMFLREMIPLYPELTELLGKLNRKDWRISIVRGLLQVLSILSWVMITSVFLLVIAISSIFLMAFQPNLTAQLIVILATLVLTLMGCLRLVAYGLTLRAQQIPSQLGEQKLHEARQRISSLSPVVAFRDMLLSEQYEATFSEIVAIYGIEFLIILA
jgi:hypothetical protein